MSLRLAVAGLAVFFALFSIQTARLWWSGFTRRWRWRRIRRRAVEGERRAERVLERAGYRVVARQVETHLWYRIDGRATRVDLRADLIVERGRKNHIVEVKTGRIAPEPTSSATRRQLLEYSCAFGVDSLLLVDPESATITEVGMPHLAAPNATGARRAILVWALATSFALLWLLARGECRLELE